jgi:hypothetical protein
MLNDDIITVGLGYFTLAACAFLFALLAFLAQESLGLGILFLLGGIVMMLAGVSKRNEYKKRADEQFYSDIAPYYVAMEESGEMINATKDLDVALREHENIRKNISRIHDMNTAPRCIAFRLNGRELTFPDYDRIINEEKELYIKRHFKNRIAVEINKAEALSIPEQKKRQLQKALDVALGSIEYTGEDRGTKETISDLESRIEGMGEITAGG